MTIEVEQLDFLLLSKEDSKGGTRFWKEVIYAGDFHREGQAGFSVDEELLDHWTATRESFLELGIAVPLTVVDPDNKHTFDPELNRGEVLAFSKRVDSKGRLGLFALCEFVDEEAAKLSRTSKVSIYSPVKYEDERGNVHHRPIRHVALTDYPVINDLDGFIAASHPVGDIEMSLKGLAKKLKIELADDDDDAKIEGKIVSAFKAASKPAPAKPPEKKPEVPPTKPTEKKEPVKVAASYINLLRENREAKIDALVKNEDGPLITPAVAKDLKEQYCGDETLNLALSSDSHDDGFDTVIAALAKNEPVLKLSEQTPGQGLKLTAAENPLIANAEKRAEAAKA